MVTTIVQSHCHVRHRQLGVLPCSRPGSFQDHQTQGRKETAEGFPAQHRRGRQVRAQHQTALSSVTIIGQLEVRTLVHRCTAQPHLLLQVNRRTRPLAPRLQHQTTQRARRSSVRHKRRRAHCRCDQKRKTISRRTRENSTHLGVRLEQSDRKHQMST